MRWRKVKKGTKTPPEKQLQKVVYAGYTDRIKAFITDLFMIYMPILYIITYVILSGKEAFLASSLAHFSGVAIYSLIYAIFIAKSGQTPGKRAYTIKVVDAKTFKNISFWRALCRFVAFLFTASTLVGAFLPFYRKDKRALHDLLCRTAQIVYEKPTI
jgi:uncharacterized RDD family membrane protein YckC